MTLVIGEKELQQLPVSVDPEIVSGAPVFQGTRVPVEALINNLEAGLTLDEFLDNFPTVTREKALRVLEFVKNTLLRLSQKAWTLDKNLRHQQNLAKRKLAFILLPTNQVPIVAALVPEIEAALNKIQTGDFVEISYP